MGLETALIAATVFSAGSSIMGGIQQNKEAKKQAALVRQEADEKARLELAEGKRYRNKQAVAYLKSGVAIDQGSPLLAMQETLDTAATNARNIRSTGAAQSSFIKRQGRAALTGGFTDALGSASGGFSKYKGLQAQGYID